MMAVAHGLSLLGVLDDVKNTIMNHIASGMCGQTKVIIPPACHNFQQESSSNIIQPSTDQSELQVFFLSKLLNKIRQ